MTFNVQRPQYVEAFNTYIVLNRRPATDVHTRPEASSFCCTVHFTIHPVCVDGTLTYSYASYPGLQAVDCARCVRTRDQFLENKFLQISLSLFGSSALPFGFVFIFYNLED